MPIHPSSQTTRQDCAPAWRLGLDQISMRRPPRITRSDLDLVPEILLGGRESGQEEIIVVDSPEENLGEFSDRMLERARVAQNLVRDLEVNMAGVAVIVRMREEMAELRHRLEQLLGEVRRHEGGS